MTLTQLWPGDKVLADKIDALLASQGLTRDANLEVTCALVDDDKVVATGSLFGPTLRCLAVDSAYQGEGLLNQLVSHLSALLVERGHVHQFVYTKPQSAKFFRGLGFYPLVELPNLVFLENRAKGFEQYLASLGPSKGPSAAIVMHANPFTLGHLSLVKKACDAHRQVHLFLLSEEGLIPRAVRFDLVKRGTTSFDNLTLHPTGPYLISSATFPSYFLREEEQVIRAQASLDCHLFGPIAERLDVTHRYVGEEPYSKVTSLYNQVLASELPKQGITLVTTPRTTDSQGSPISASKVRQALAQERWDLVKNWVPVTTEAFFRSPEGQKIIEALRRSGDLVHY